MEPVERGPAVFHPGRGEALPPPLIGSLLFSLSPSHLSVFFAQSSQSDLLKNINQIISLPFFKTTSITTSHWLQHVLKVKSTVLTLAHKALRGLIGCLCDSSSTTPSHSLSCLTCDVSVSEQDELIPSLGTSHSICSDLTLSPRIFSWLLAP